MEEIRRRSVLALFVALVPLATSGCEYVRLLRPSVLKQLNPRVVRLVNYLPEVDEPNEAMVGRLLAHGGLVHADPGRDGVMRAEIRAPDGEFIWEPAIVVMPHGGELELDFSNDDFVLHAAYVPSEGDQEIIFLPARERGRARLLLDGPGYYFFGCPISNHAGRGMLGLIIVEGEVPPDARLDRPRQPQPRRY
jgi:PQQ system protein